MQAKELDKALQELEQRQFYDSSLVHFAEIMRWQTGQTIESWGENLLNSLIPFLSGFQAALYSANYHEQTLSFIAGYGVHQVQNPFLVFGEGLVGQVAKSKEIILLENLSDAYFSPHISTFELKPNNLLIMPLLYNGQVRGVLEIAFLKEISAKYQEFLRRVCDDMGSHLNALNKDTQLKRSLAEIKKSEERFRRLSEVTQEGIVFVQNGRIDEANGTFANMFGYELPELKGKWLSDFLTNHYNEDAQILISKAADKPTEITAIRKDQSVFPVEIESREVEYHNDLLNVMTFRDITRHKKAELMISQQEEELANAQKIVDLYDIIDKKNKNILASINYAKRIQQSILPELKYIHAAFPQSFVLYLPKDVVSGDFYWFAENENYFFIAVVDCTGHGVPGAFMSLIGYLELDRIVKEKNWEKPRTVLSHLNTGVNRLLHQEQSGINTSRDGMDMAFCAFRKDFSKMYFAGANRPLIYFRGDEVIQIKGSPFAVGGSFQYKTGKNFEQHELILQSGDSIYLSTDGYADQINPKGEKYMTKRSRVFLQKIHDLPMFEQKTIMEKEFNDWKDGKAQVDDVLVIGIHIP